MHARFDALYFFYPLSSPVFFRPTNVLSFSKLYNQLVDKLKLSITVKIKLLKEVLQLYMLYTPSYRSKIIWLFDLNFDNLVQK
jgi:hypothetical protein